MTARKTALLGSASRVLSNNLCACCGKRQPFSNHDGIRARVPSDTLAKHLCNNACHTKWQAAHCAWCGETPQTTTISITLADGRKYCDTRHMNLHKKWLEKR